MPSVQPQEEPEFDSNMIYMLELLGREYKISMINMLNSATEMKNAFERLIDRLHMTKKRLNKLEEMSTETYKTNMQRDF